MEEEPTAKRRRKESKKQLLVNNGDIYTPPRLIPPNYIAADATTVPRPPGFLPTTEVQVSGNVSVFATDDYAYSKRGYRFSPAIARPSMSALKFTACEAPPYCARLSYEDRSPQSLLISQSGTVASTLHGFRSARANVCVREGDWYYEVKVLKGIPKDSDGTNSHLHDAHVRLGFSRRESSMEAPVGHDGYGYGLRDVSGQTVHLSRPKPFMEEPIRTGDIIGLRISIPSRPEETKPVAGFFRDRYPVRYKGQLFFETLDYVPTKPMTELLTPVSVLRKKREGAKHHTPTTIAGSFITVYKNGKDMGKAFTDLNEFLPPHSKFQSPFDNRMFDDGMVGYYPTVSVYREGAVEVNFGPNFAHPPPEGVRPLCERYDEQIAEDLTLDIIDQADFERLDQLRG